jgi:hypothetical protein
MSAEAQARLRACLQAETIPVANPVLPRAAKFTWPNWFSFRWAAPVAAALLLVVGWLSWSVLNRQGSQAAELSDAVLAEAAGDHRTCATHFASRPALATPLTPEWMKEQHPAYAQLAEVAAAGAEGLELKSIHVCKFAGRQFAHLVYAQDAKMVSLLVTPRDRSCLRAGQLPKDNGLAAGLQHAHNEAYQISAYQTAKYIVFVVSELPETENQQLAERLAAPVSVHLRQIEKSIAWLKPLFPAPWLAGLRVPLEQASERREKTP